MKKYFLLAMVFVFAMACQSDKGFVISGTTDLEDGSLVILLVEDPENEMGIRNIDTAKVEKGKFELKGSVEFKDLYYLKTEPTNQFVPFILDNVKLTAQVFKDSIQKSVFTGLSDNDDLRAFNALMNEQQKKLEDFQRDNDELMNHARRTNDTVTSNRLMEQYFALKESLVSFQVEYVGANPNKFISLILIKDLLNNPEVDTDKLLTAFNKMPIGLKESPQGKSISETLNAFSKIAIGQKAPDFTAPMPDGKESNLYSHLGKKVTVIDFWASWCRPCRVENPNMVKLYNEFKDQGLEIIGFSLDQQHDGEGWRNAIIQDNLTWPQFSNLKFWKDPVAQMYQIKYIPYMVVLDSEGVIVAKNIRGEELRAKVLELIGAVN